jgi:flagellar protein FliL
MAAKTEDAETKEEEKEAKAGGSKLKLILMVLPMLLLVLALVYFLVLKKTPTPEEVAAAAEEAAKPVPGVVVPLENITINLEGAHFLQLGMTLQATAEVAEAPSGAKALDAAISLYSGMAIDEIADAKGRDKTKKELVEKVSELYEGEIYDIYFTSFVYQ